MATSAITAFHPIHNAGSNGSTTVSGVGKFIADILIVDAVFRNGHWVLNDIEIQ